MMSRSIEAMPKGPGTAVKMKMDREISIFKSTIS